MGGGERKEAKIVHENRQTGLRKSKGGIGQEERGRFPKLVQEWAR